MSQLWKYTTGEKGINRIRVYERRPGGPLYIEWYDRMGRHQKALTTMNKGTPVISKDLAKRIADRAAAAQREKREQESAHHLLGVRQPRTLLQLLDAYHAAHPIAPPTRVARKGEWSKGHAKEQKVNKRFWLLRLRSKTLITDVTPARVKEAIAAAWSEQKITSTRTEQKRLAYIQAAFTYAQTKLKWIGEDDNLSAIDIPDARGKSLPYSIEEVQKLLPKTIEVDLRCATLAHIYFTSGRRLTAVSTLPITAYTGDGDVGCLQMPDITDKARHSGEVYVTGTTKQLIEELIATPAAQSSGLMFPRGELNEQPKSKLPATDKFLLELLHSAEVLAEVETISGRGYHAFKRAYSGPALSFDPIAASKQSGTSQATLGKDYLQDEAKRKIRLAHHMDAVAQGAS